MLEKTYRTHQQLFAHSHRMSHDVRRLHVNTFSLKCETSRRGKVGVQGRVSPEKDQLVSVQYPLAKFNQKM